MATTTVDCPPCHKAVNCSLDVLVTYRGSAINVGLDNTVYMPPLIAAIWYNDPKTIREVTDVICGPFVAGKPTSLDVVAACAALKAAPISAEKARARLAAFDLDGFVAEANCARLLTARAEIERLDAEITKHHEAVVAHQRFVALLTEAMRPFNDIFQAMTASVDASASPAKRARLTEASSE